MAQVVCLFVVARACRIRLFQVVERRGAKRIFQPDNKQKHFIGKVDNVVLPLESHQIQLYKTTKDLFVPDGRL